MTIYGVTTTGFVAPALSDLTTAIGADLLADVDPLLDLDPDQLVGQLVGIFANYLAAEWEASQTAYNGFDDTRAQGVQADTIAALTGTQRVLDTPSSVVINCTLANGTTLGTSSTVALDSDSTNTWTLFGANASTPGPFTAPATGTYPLLFKSTKVGPVAGASGHLTTIVTAVAGWSVATNPVDATRGTVRESDAQLLIRRRVELVAQGASSVDSIYAQLTDPSIVPGVISATVLENITNVVDGNGLLPHSLIAIIWDGPSLLASNTTIANVIWKNKAAGVATNGTTVVAVTDAQGISHNVAFQRVTQSQIYVSITVVPGTNYAGDAAVQAAIAAYATTPGQTIVFERVKSIAMDVPGVIDVTACMIGIGSASGSTNVTISPFAIGVFNTAHTTVTS